MQNLQCGIPGAHLDGRLVSRMQNGLLFKPWTYRPRYENLTLRSLREGSLIASALSRVETEQPQSRTQRLKY